MAETRPYTHGGRHRRLTGIREDRFGAWPAVAIDFQERLLRG
jgi:hypothetical protein